jgi:hypothetical protein
MSVSDGNPTEQVVEKFVGHQAGEDCRSGVQGDDAGGVNGGPFTVVPHGGLQRQR